LQIRRDSQIVGSTNKITGKESLVVWTILTNSIVVLLVSIALAANPSQGKPVKPTAKKLPTLTATTYFDPGHQFLRAAQDSLASTGVGLSFDVKDGNWLKDPPLQTDLAVQTQILSGKAVTVSMRPLSEQETNAGLASVPLGYFAAVIVAHPSAPVRSITREKWAGMQGRAVVEIVPWSAIGEAEPTARKDSGAKLKLPDQTFRTWAEPLAFLGLLQKNTLDLLPKAKDKPVEPLHAVFAAANDEHALAVHGYDLVTKSLIHPLMPVKLLPVDGVAPSPVTIRDGSYPFSRALLLVYGRDAASDQKSPLGKLLSYLQTENAAEVARLRALIPPVKPALAKRPAAPFKG
jgi:hypothetical protein